MGPLRDGPGALCRRCRLSPRAVSFPAIVVPVLGGGGDDGPGQPERASHQGRERSEASHAVRCHLGFPSRAATAAGSDEVMSDPLRMNRG